MIYIQVAWTAFIISLLISLLLIQLDYDELALTLVALAGAAMLITMIWSIS